MKDILLSTVVLLLTLGCVTFALFTSIDGAKNYSLTYDETFHRDWNQRLLYEGESERESVYNYISTTPVILLNILFADTVEAHFPEAKEGRWFYLRLGTTMWLAVLIFVTFCLARYVAGLYAACFTIGLLCLEPNIIAHSSLVTVDVAFAAMTVLIMYQVLRYSEKLSVRWGLLLGVSTGFIFCVKYTSFLLVPVIFLYPLWKHRLRFFTLRNLFTILCAIVLGSYVINAFYLFARVGVPLGDYHFFNEKFLWLQAHFPSLRIPLPKDFITGFDHLMEAGKRSEWNVVFWGEWMPQGSVWYFIGSWIFKTPLTIIALSLFAPILVFTRLRTFLKPAFLFVGATCVLLFLYFSIFVRVQVGFRYVLMCIPLFLSVVGAVFAGVMSQQRLVLLFVLCIVAGVIELYPFRDNILSFSNSFIYPKKNAYKYLSDSNIDWGQKRDLISKRVEELGLTYEQLDPPYVLPGYNLITINRLLGVFWNYEQYRWLRENLEPERHIDHTLLLYHVSQEDYERYLQSDRLAEPLPSESSFFPLKLTERELSVILVRPTKENSHLIVEAGEDTKLRFKERRGKSVVGQPDHSDVCKGIELSKGQELNFLLKGGTRYQFCFSGSVQDSEVAVLSDPNKIAGFALVDKEP